MTDSNPIKRSCGAHAEHHRLLAEDPSYLAARQRIESAAWAARGTARTTPGQVTRIPVVVHVVWNRPEQNISDAQVESQIAVLNADFRKRNGDIGGVPAVWRELAADAMIEFDLAKVAPDGQSTTGITRTQTAVASFGQAGNPIKAAATGGIAPWPADRYLNIWVAPALNNNVLGYAQFPGGPAATDGVVIVNTAFGTNGTAAAPFNLGRTATHEVGHWLDLFHIWGDDGDACFGTDRVDDTPNAAGPNYGTPAFPHVTCTNGPNGDMFMNYMDYTHDSAMFMFTQGQVARMRDALNNSRAGLSPPFTPVYQQDDPGQGIGGYDLKSGNDRAFAFDYDGTGKLDHMALYRPGTGTMWILKRSGTSFTPVYQQDSPGQGIGGYDLRSAADRAFAFDYDSSGKLDHMALYRPGTGTMWI
ncbi:zinc metalloprotease, partial [Magnetospirillum sp. LM-5]|uniref:zinc metalloprotease n=1 Tax=Magnetospirillum sp. LM-5 TaxID=2681466 RepID=UPI00156E7730